MSLHYEPSSVPVVLAEVLLLDGLLEPPLLMELPPEHVHPRNPAAQVQDSGFRIQDSPLFMELPPEHVHPRNPAAQIWGSGLCVLSFFCSELRGFI